MPKRKKKQKKDKFCTICADLIEQEKDRLCTSYVNLTKRQTDFLKNISEYCECSGGKELCRTVAMRVFISVLMRKELDIMAKTTRSKKCLAERFSKTFRKCR